MMFDTQINENFIGHEHELQQFKEWFADTDPTSPWILFFHDALKDPQQKGGVGKTWLLRKCASLVQTKTAVAMVDFFSVADRNGLAVTQHIVQSLHNMYPFWSPKAYLETLAEYQQAVHEHKQTAGLDTKLRESLVEDLQTLEQQLERTDKYLLICFDTFELIEEQPLIAVLGFVHTFPDRYHFEHIGVVIAGRNAPDWTHPNWRGRESEVRCVPIEPFNLEETVQFIQSNSTTSTSIDVASEQARAIYLRTQGRPILVGLVTDVLNYHVTTLHELAHTQPDSFEAYLVSQINNLDRPINWIILFMAHIYHRFNPAILHWIFRRSLDIQNLVSDVDMEKLSERLLDLSFVRRSGSGSEDTNVALHDEMRRLVNKYNWPAQEETSKRYRRALSLGAIDYYEHELRLKPQESLQQVYIVEMLYHQLYVDIHAGFASFEKHMAQAIGQWQNAFARSLLQEAQKFQDQFTGTQCDTLLRDEAALLRREENYTDALKLYQQLETQANPDWLKLHQGNLLYEQGICYQGLSNFTEATDYYSRSLDIMRTEGTSESLSRIGNILSRLGTIHKRLGNLQEADRYYQESIASYKQRGDERGKAEVLTNLGTLYRLQGKLDDALRYTMVALRIRRDLYAASTIASEVGVGTTLSAIGVIYFKYSDFVSAQRYFQEAYDIYVRNRYRTGISEIATRFGQVAMERHDLENAVQWFDDAYKTAVGVDAETEINSLNKRGWAQVLQGQLNEATLDLTKAIARAREVQDYYQLVESLIDLAITFHRQNQLKEAEDLLQEADTIASSFKYYYLLSLAQLARAENAYRVEAYQEAFHHYEQFCYYAALYNPLEHERAVRRTINDLLAIPQRNIPAILESMLADWSSHEQELGSRSQLLVKSLEEVRILLGI